MDNNTKPDVFIRKDLIESIKEFLTKDTNNKVICLQGKTGSGKSKTLNYISHNPEYFGEKTIVVYINLKECNLRDYNVFSKGVFSKIKGKLSEYWINLNYKDDYLNQHTTHEEIKILYQEIHDQLTDNRLILILDEFQLLLQAGNDILDNLYLLIKKIQDISEKTKLILTGDNKFSFPQNPEMRNLLKSTPVIDLGDITVKQLVKIIEKNTQTVSLSKQTVDEILKISGNNPYILENIVLKYLNNYANEFGIEIDGNTILKIADEIVNDPRPEFEHAWNHKIDWEHQIVLSALADPSITKKYQDGAYYLNDSDLLEIIFGKNNMESNFSVLIANDTILRKHEYKFEAYPFKSHLLGRWVEKKHSFNQTIHDNFPKIVEKVPFSEMFKLLDALPADRFSSIKNFDKLKKFSSIYNNFLNSIDWEINRRKNAAQFIKSFFTKLLSFEIEGIRNEQNDEYMMVDIEKSAIGKINMLLVFFQYSFSASKHYINWIEGIINQNPGIVPLLFYFKKDVGFEELTKKKYYQIITFKEDDIKKILISSNSREVFKRHVIENIRPSLINPYQEHGTVTGNAFFGRNKEISKIFITAPELSFHIIGPRKIGKSSLLFEIKNQIEKRISSIGKGKNSFSKPLFLDLEGSPNYKEFYSTFTLEISQTYGLLRTINSLESFKGAIHEIFRKCKHRICIIIDEVDGLLKFDKSNGYELFGLIRSLSKEYCRFIIAGATELYHDKRSSYNSPFVNFGSEIMLGALDFESAKSLITDPMESIGILKPDNSCIQRILEISACQPSIIQFICKNLIEHLDEEHKKNIELDDVEQVYDTKCKRFIFDEIIMFYTDRDSFKPTEKFILLVMIDMYLKKKKDTHILDLQMELKNMYSLDLVEDDIYHYLQNLEIRNVLIYGKNKNFKFALPILPKLFQETTDLEREKNKLLKELKQKENGA